MGLKLQQIIFDFTNHLLKLIQYKSLFRCLIFLIILSILGIFFIIISFYQILPSQIIKRQCFSLHKPIDLFVKPQQNQIQIYQFIRMNSNQYKYIKSMFKQQNNISDSQLQKHYLHNQNCGVLLQNLNYSLSFQTVRISYHFNHLFIDKKNISQYNFKIFKYFINTKIYCNEYLQQFIGFFIDMDILLVQQIMIFLYSNSGLAQFNYKIGDRYQNIDFNDRKANKLFILLKIFLATFIASSIIALYNYMAIYIIPSVYLIFNRIRYQNDQFNDFIVYTNAPWIGAYQYPFTLQRNRGFNKLGLLPAFMKYFFFFIILYLLALNTTKVLLFNSPSNFQHNVDFSNIITILQLQSLFFARTRTSIKFMSRMLAVLIIMYCYSIKKMVFVMKSLPFLLLFTFSQLVVLLFIYFLQKPATQWNHTFIYTPSIHNPRCLYNRFFNLNWAFDMPPIWSMFTVNQGADTFLIQQLALVSYNQNQLQGLSALNLQMNNDQ